MFTMAHSITLALGAYGLISLPPRLVEPMIALSIVYVAFQNLMTDQLSRHRLPVIFGFGLLHGLGFASILTEFGLPEDLYLAALLWFNIGVEFGQLALLVCAYLAITVWFNDPSTYRRVVSVPGSLLIAAVGAFWVLERVVYFLLVSSWQVSDRFFDFIRIKSTISGTPYLGGANGSPLGLKKSKVGVPNPS